MSKHLVAACASLILFQVWVTVVAFTSTSLPTNPNSEVLDVSHDDLTSSMEANIARNKRLVVETVVMKGIGFAIKLTDLITNNVMTSFNKNETDKNHKEIIDHFQRIENELEEQNEELQTINREIQILGLSVGYSEHEKKIKNSLLALHQYLEHPDERNRNIFMDVASQLSQSLTDIVEGLLGKHVFIPDIMAVLRKTIGCHGRRLHKKIKPIMSIVMTRLWVRSEYHRIRNVSESDSSHFKKFIMASTTTLKNRLDDLAVECQADEKNVSEQIGEILKTKSARNQKELAKFLLEFLEDKYDTKKWIVVLLPDVKTTAGKSHLDFLSVNKVHFIQSGKFHTVSVHGIFAAAISVDPSAIDQMKFVDLYFEKFHIPIHTSAQYGMTTIMQRAQGYRQRWDKRLLLIHENLHLFLTPVRKQAVVESLVIETHCTSTDEEFEEMVTIVGSNGTQWRWKSDQFDDYGKSNWCIDPLVIVIPVNSSSALDSSTSSPDELIDESCENQDPETFGLLRNEFGQGYLSVQGDSSQDGAYVTLERQWRNNSGQRWRFKNSQLINDFGKCLTASTTTSFLFQTTCNFSSTSYNMMRQTWRRTGLQIVTTNINPLKARLLNDLCLGFLGSKDDDVMYAVLDRCDFTPPFLWFDWDLDCEDVVHHRKNYTDANSNGSRPLRNEFSRRYLSVYEKEDYLNHRPWSNHPGQNWKFVHGQLRNNNGKCLAGKGWNVLQVECSGITKSKRWTYNEKRQIVSAEGFCLSVGDKSGYVIYNYCKDDPEHRWY